MEIIKTPWKDKFLDLVAETKHSIKITSPFIKNNICKDILDIVRGEVSIDLITSYKIVNIYSGALDLDGLENILNNNGIVRNFSKLHAKIYLFDDKKAIVTSGNLTNGGLINNFEYGVYFNDINNVEKVSVDFNLLVNNECTGIINTSHIDETRKILQNIPAKEKITLPKISLENDDDVLQITGQSIIHSLTGWKKEVFKCINKIEAQTFNLQEINRYEPLLKAIYPENNHISDKVRQQLQQLRDIGLIEFLGNGRYKKLWK